MEHILFGIVTVLFLIALGAMLIHSLVGEEYEDYEYSDFNGNPHTKESHWYYNKRILELGVKC